MTVLSVVLIDYPNDGNRNRSLIPLSSVAQVRQGEGKTLIEFTDGRFVRIEEAWMEVYNAIPGIVDLAPHPKRNPK